MLHLGDARNDRVHRSELAITAGDPKDQPAPAPGSLGATRRALAIVALRSDELVTSTEDEPARRTAADLRDLARRALTDTGSGEHSIARIELHPATNSADAELSPTNRAVAPMPELPDREREILRLVATGATNAAIGRSLYLSEATVKQYVSRLMRKFDRENRTQLAIMAVRWFDGV
ncbi:response regulator transcription factor [Yimella sp. RIT 621]|nr:response regulator transcription factor [Yimella sp. RIT 621]